MSPHATASAYMLSLLARQHQLLGMSFFDRYPSDWLVWEQGPWRPSRSILTNNVETTLAPSSTQPPRPSQDAMCFELKRAPGSVVTLGRGSENQIVINDLTVSRSQFVLEFVKSAWRVRSEGTPLTVGGTAVTEAGAPLHNGFVIAAGDVRLTFYAARGFAERLDLESQKHR